MKLKFFGLLVSVFILLSTSISFAGSSGVTIEKIRIWESGEIYLVLSGNNLNPAGCDSPSAPQFWILKPSNEETKSRMYSMALTAKSTSNTVKVQIATECEGKYPIIQMIELE